MRRVSAVVSKTEYTERLCPSRLVIEVVDVEVPKPRFESGSDLIVKAAVNSQTTSTGVYVKKTLIPNTNTAHPDRVRLAFFQIVSLGLSARTYSEARENTIDLVLANANTDQTIASACVPLSLLLTERPLTGAPPPVSIGSAPGYDAIFRLLTVCRPSVTARHNHTTRQHRAQTMPSISVAHLAIIDDPVNPHDPSKRQPPKLTPRRSTQSRSPSPHQIGAGTPAPTLTSSTHSLPSPSTSSPVSPRPAFSPPPPQRALPPSAGLLDHVPPSPLPLASLSQIREWASSAAQSVAKLRRAANRDTVVFGQSLDSLEAAGKLRAVVHGGPASVAHVVLECALLLTRNAHHVVGIFRIPGSSQSVDLYKAIYNCGYSLEFAQDEDCTTVASLLTSYLRSLPEPLPPRHVISALAALPSPSPVEAVKRCLGDMSVAQSQTLMVLLHCLYTIHQHSNVNQMHAENLARCVFSDHASVMTHLIAEYPRLFHEQSTETTASKGSSPKPSFAPTILPQGSRSARPPPPPRRPMS